MAKYVELYMDQGATFNYVVELRDGASGAKLNLDSYSARSQVRRNPITSNITGNLVCTIVDSANGRIQLSMDAANTSKISNGTYIFDLELTYGSTISKPIRGLITVTGSVTK